MLSALTQRSRSSWKGKLSAGVQSKGHETKSAHLASCATYDHFCWSFGQSWNCVLLTFGAELGGLDALERGVHWCIDLLLTSYPNDKAAILNTIRTLDTGRVGTISRDRTLIPATESSPIAHLDIIESPSVHRLSDGRAVVPVQDNRRIPL